MDWFKVMFIKVKPEIRQLIKEVTNARGENLSSFVRRAILKELATLGLVLPERGRALGIG